MNTPQQGVPEMRKLVERFDQAGWLQPDTLKDVFDTGSFALALTPIGVERLKVLHSILVKDLKKPTVEELHLLVELLDFLQKKYYPDAGKNPPNQRPSFLEISSHHKQSAAS